MYERDWTVRFSDTDRFGIAFYPEIIEEVHDTADRFMADIGWPLWELPGDHDIGLPIVEVGSEFHEMLHSGDVVTIELDPDVSDRSVRFQYTGRVDGTEAFSAFEQRVCVEVGGDEAVPIPADLRAALDGATDA
jgi:4-hydroxybenzoyl-CoA thioesterase